MNRVSTLSLPYSTYVGTGTIVSYRIVSNMKIENRKSKIENRKSKIENRKLKIENRKSNTQVSNIEYAIR